MMSTIPSHLDVEFRGEFYTADKANGYYEELLQLPFEQISFHIGGKILTPRRKVIAYADEDIAPYEFSGVKVENQSWTPVMMQLKKEVENEVGCDFNYALLNYYEDGNARISAHRDDERSLDPSAPIACVSLGATRMMRYSKPFETNVDIPLTSGSLLIMQPDANREWKHEILLQKDVREGRISVTFRKMLQGEPPRKRVKTLEEEFEDPSMDLYFSNIMPTTSGAMLIPAVKRDQNICKVHIGDQIYICVELYREEMKVHIRQFRDIGGVQRATRNGIVLTLGDWYVFSKKILDFNLLYKSSSFIANNNISVLNLKDKALIKSFFNVNCISLKESHINHLKDNVELVNSKILNYMYDERMPLLIRHVARITSSPSEDVEIDTQLRFTKYIEDDVRVHFNELYECYGCKIDHPSQRQHDCLNESDRGKFNDLGDSIMMLVDIGKISRQFIKNCVSETFVKSINYRAIKDVIFR